MPIVPSPSQPDTNQQLPSYPMSNNPELIELLVTDKTGTSEENFFQKFQSILNKTPKIGTTSKAQFFPYSVIGTFTVLPNTQLMNDLNIKRVYINPIKSSEKTSSKKVVKTVKVALELEKEGKKSLQLYTFASTKDIGGAQHWNENQLTELIAHTEITQNNLQNYMVDGKVQISGTIYQIDSQFNLHVENIKVGSGDKLKNYKELSSEFESLIEQAPLPKPEENKGIFKQIIQLTKETLNPKTGKPETIAITDLESNFKRLASYSSELDETTDVIQREALLDRVAQAVEAAGSHIFSDLSKVYNHWKPILGLGEAEVCAHGYSNGVVEHLFKYRYALDISVEKNLGKGRADLTFLSRLDGNFNKRWEAVPVNAEFKAGNESPDEALAQTGKQGYLHHSPRMRTVSTRGVALGVNFGFSEPVSSAIKTIKVEPTNFIKTLLEVGDKVLQSGVTQELSESIKAGLSDLHYSTVMSGEANEKHYVNRLLLGQVMGCSAMSGTSVKMFMSTHNKDNYPEEDSIFLVKRADNVYVLNLIRNFPLFSGPELNQVPSLEIMEKVFESDKLVENSQYVKINIFISDLPPNRIKIKLDKGYLKSHSDKAGRLGTRYNLDKGTFESIETFPFIDNQGELAVERLKQQLFDKKELINSENDVKAFIQGGLLASEKYQVFPESYHVQGGIADLVVVPINRGSTELIKVFELKYGETQQQAEQKHAIAQEQIQNYVKNLKSFTDGREVELVVLTYDAESGQKENLFLYNKLPTQKIVHTSGSERVDNSPEHMDVDEEKSPPHEQDVEMLPVDKAVLPLFGPANTEGLKTPPYKSPSSDYAGDVESNAGSPDKRRTGVSFLGGILGGIFSALGGLAGAFLATGAAITGSVANAISAIRSGLGALSNNLPNTPALQGEMETLNSDLTTLLEEVEIANQQGKLNERLREKVIQQQEKVNDLNKKYEEKAKKVQQKIAKRRQQAEDTRAKNKRKKEMAGPSRAKRGTVEWPMVEKIDNQVNISESILNGMEAETIIDPNKLFSLCTLQPHKLDMNSPQGDERCIEETELACYLEIDYQDEDVRLIDVSLWDLKNQTVSYAACQDQFTLALPLLNGCEKKLVVSNASSITYEFIDINARFFFLNTTQASCSHERPEENTNVTIRYEVDRNTATLSSDIDRHITTLLPEIDRHIVVSNCSSVELSTVDQASYVEGDCVINPMANSLDVIEINRPEYISSLFIKLSSWNILQQVIELTNNTVVITINDREAGKAGFFQVKLTDYFVFDWYFSQYYESDAFTLMQYSKPKVDYIQYDLSDKVFEEINLIFTAEQVGAIREGARFRVTFFEIKVPLPQALLAQEGDKASRIVDWYQTITQTEAGTEVLYGEATNPEGYLRGFGSRHDDQMVINEALMFVYGGEGHDSYFLGPNEENSTLYINNNSQDQARDKLFFAVPFRTINIRLYRNNSVALKSTQEEFNREVVLTNYCRGPYHQHLDVLTEDGFLFELPDCEFLTRHKNFRQIVKNLRLSEFSTESTQPLKRQKRAISSGSARVTPFFQDLLEYVLTPVKFMLNNVNTVNHRDSADSAFSYCDKDNSFTEQDCWKSQFSLGLLGYCFNHKQAITWFSKTRQEGIVPTLAWYAISDNRISKNTSTDYLNTQANRLSLQANVLYFFPEYGCPQVLNLNNMSNASLATLFPYLPEQGKQWLFSQWHYKKEAQDKAEQDEIAITLFKQQSLHIGLNYLANVGWLHTVLGDYFQAMGLRPHWQEHDLNYFSARWLTSIQQWRLGGTYQVSAIVAVVVETALLHPKVQAAYSFYWPNIKARYKKQALRFCTDLLQWGNFNFALLPNLLEILFMGYPIESITWGLRAAFSFYSINNDPSYYYLGIALFLLPQLPLLLEHVGIPVTAYVSKALEKLAQLFFLLSLLEQFKPTPDQSRLVQHTRELQAAEQRVIKGKARVSAIVKPLTCFFNKPLLINEPSMNYSESENNAHYRRGG